MTVFCEAGSGSKLQVPISDKIKGDNNQCFVVYFILSCEVLRLGILNVFDNSIFSFDGFNGITP